MQVLKKDGSSVELDTGDILYFSSYQNTIYVHTVEDEYLYPMTLSDLLSAYRDKGFERLDRSIVVNSTLVTRYDGERKVVWFGGGEEAKFAPVSEPNERKAKEIAKSKQITD